MESIPWYGKFGSLVFKPAAVDECVFYRGSTIFIVFVVDGLVFDMNNANLDYFVEELRGVGLDADDQGQPSDYVGINIKREEYGSYHFLQQPLIITIIDNVGLINFKLFKQVPTLVY